MPLHVVHISKNVRAAQALVHAVLLLLDGAWVGHHRVLVEHFPAVLAAVVHLGMGRLTLASDTTRADNHFEQ